MGDNLDDDDLFASLGGALMKNLLADLNDEGGSGGLLSLEELEQELSHLDDRSAPQTLSSVPELPNSAASMVLMAQQQDQRLNISQPTSDPSAPVDAWALSLEKFTAASLQDDFLLADSARKAKSGPAETPPQPTQLQSSFLNEAEEYDVSEPMTVSAPPGLPSAGNAVTQSLVHQLTSKLETVVTASDETPTVKTAAQPMAQVPKPKPIPKTPQNSVTLNLPKPPPPTPQNSISTNLGAPPAGGPTKLTQGTVQIQKPPPTPPNTVVGPPRDVIQDPTGGPPPPHQGGPPPSVWNQPPRAPVPPPPQQMAGPPMMMQPPPPGQRPIVFCDPTPQAQPVPASVLASTYMSTRDISYVVHSILKPLLNHQQQNPPTPFDYDRAFWQRAGGVPPPTNTYNRRQGGKQGNKKQGQKAENEMESREKKAKDWSAEHSVLGRTAKSNVTRPRALIAQPKKSDDDETKNKENSEQRQRQALWKSRIYCDQAYQAYLKVVETWHAVITPNQNMSPAAAASLQPHLFKLLKCLGIVKSEQEQDEDESSDHQQVYAVVNEGALPLVAKLPKGRILLARVLEQALLPPAAVNALLPVLFKAIYELPLPPPPPLPGAGPPPLNAEAAAASGNAHMVDERLFMAISRVLHTLPDLPGSDILQCLDLASENSSVSLQSTVRMSAVHALLQRGSQLASSDESFAPVWKTREEAFLKIISG